MPSRWSIKYRLVVGAVILLVTVAGLAFSSFRGVYAYRGLVRSISVRATELPLAADLEGLVSDLRYTFRGISRVDEYAFLQPSNVDRTILQQEFGTQLIQVREALRRYREQLEVAPSSEFNIDDRRSEQETVHSIETSLEKIARLTPNRDWIFDQLKLGECREELDELHRLASDLPSHLHERMHTLTDDVRLQYRTWIVLSWITSIVTAVSLLIAARCFWVWVFAPLRVLVRGSRRVARGDFSHRIHLQSNDEMDELANAFNDMTGKFQQIHDDLNHQVRERTREVVQSERLAGVGFLAAGVAHEINNPLMSIAGSAEALESRLDELLVANESLPEDERDEDLTVVRDYLRRIQDEAFRCKGITERLLDFSRIGDMEKHDTDVTQLVRDVVDMVRHVGKYRQKKLEFHCDEPVWAPVNPQEIKQVALNLVVNGLDSLEPGGTVTVRLRKTDQHAELVVSDTGCGMTEEVLEHLFQPFFTRRRDGQGTGLGLSITWRIVNDHGGRIAASSEGAGKGSEFRVTLPLEHHEEKQQARRGKAA